MSLNLFIISTGSELTSGKSIDSNSSWIATQLLGLGYQVKKISVLPDDPNLIESEIQFLASFSGKNLIIITGGLGATADDYTLAVVCKITGKEAVTHDKARERLEFISTSRGRAYQEIFPISLRQTTVPATSHVLENEIGIAPGFFIELNPNSKLVAFPGVPREMKAMFQNEFIPLFKKTYLPKELYSRSRSIWGLGEVIFQNDFIRPNEEFIKENEIEWGVTANTGFVLTTFRSANEDALKSLVSKLDKKYSVQIANNVQESIHDMLLSSRLTVSTAESCTGGLIGKLFTDRSGCSIYYHGTIVAYQNEIKTKFLGVKEETIRKFGSVSEEACIEMAVGVQEKLNTHYSISVTGIAGPTGETEDKKVGLVFIGIKSHKRSPKVFKYQLSFNREVFREYVSNTAMFHFYQTLKEDIET
ncbi:MAG: nicotinamide-nucleotide amidohydrolase family protein [Leptospiraceae bacterium]|nr:nicotinamide-nucleotide amidohydrolase family protein [Leptospiraceae bacterium]